MLGLGIGIGIPTDKKGGAYTPQDPNFVVAANDDQVIKEGGEDIITQN